MCNKHEYTYIYIYGERSYIYTNQVKKQSNCCVYINEWENTYRLSFCVKLTEIDKN